MTDKSIGLSEDRYTKSSLGYYKPFQYQEMSFPVPKNHEDLHTLTLSQCCDYVKVESPRVRCRSDFYKRWSNRLVEKVGFRKVYGMCSALSDMATPKRYVKEELDALKNCRIINHPISSLKPQVPSKQSPKKNSLEVSVNHWTRYKRKSLNNKFIANNEIKEFEDKLPSLRGSAREIYAIDRKPIKSIFS